MKRDFNIHAVRNAALNTFFDETISEEGLTSSAALVWLCCFRHTQWSTGLCSLSHSRIAEQCKISTRQVKRIVSYLRGKKLLCRIKRGNSLKPSLYTILAEPGEFIPQALPYVNRKRKGLS